MCSPVRNLCICYFLLYINKKISDLNIAILATKKNEGSLPINNNELQFIEILQKVFRFFIGKQ